MGPLYIVEVTYVNLMKGPINLSLKRVISYQKLTYQTQKRSMASSRFKMILVTII